MSKTKKWIISGSAALLLGAGVYVTQRGEEPKTNERSAAVAVVERRDMEVVAESAGLVEPLRVVEVKSQASGEVLKVHYDTGDTVAEGTLLAEIEPRPATVGRVPKLDTEGHGTLLPESPITPCTQAA